jgi:hypothetical protein
LATEEGGREILELLMELGVMIRLLLKLVLELFGL